MEKKGNRVIQSSAKGLGTDSKKSQDVACGKAWPRNGRRREPSSGTFQAKTEPTRKPIPQRSKLLDKRPKARGVYNQSSTASGNENSCLEHTYEPELESVFIQGSKKQSLNHLLNFHYAPRDNNNQKHVSYGRKNSYRSSGLGKHKYNKEQFIQANCQFVVRSTGDYKQYMNNPDALVDWDLIEQINIQVNEVPSCPICLYPPTAAKMTRCGHIYCWPCLLHYLSLTDKNWQKCPICFEAVHKFDLKSVVSIPHEIFNVNETITFKLMKRMKGSLIAYPIDEDMKSDENAFNFSDKMASNVYCKLLLANKDNIMSIIAREKHELSFQLMSNDDAPEKCFVEQALNLLQEREASLSSSNSLDDCFSKLTVEDEQPGPSASKYHYFYQAADGQHIYLHALNVKILEHTYGSLEFSPPGITGRILEKEGGSMTEELRNRFRCLQHLPLTCQFEVAEIHLGAPTVSHESLKYFKEQIELRRKRRQKRTREEKRREKRITDEENRQMGIFPEASLQLESHNQFPEFGENLLRNRTVSDSTSISSANTEEHGDFMPIAAKVESNNEISFAKMLSTAPRPTWPQLKTSVKAASTSKIAAEKRDDFIDEEHEEYAMPAFNRSFSDAIAMALEEAALGHVDSLKGNNSKKKKKKNKQKVLFANSMAYMGN